MQRKRRNHSLLLKAKVALAAVTSVHTLVDTADFVDYDLLDREAVASTQMVLDLARVAREVLPRRSVLQAAQ